MQVMGIEVPSKLELDTSNRTLDQVAYMIERVAERHPETRPTELVEMVRAMRHKEIA